jgi:phage terminase small subunit
MRKNATISISTKELDFLRHYADLESETFGNAYRSALKAGYSASYARVIRRHYHPWRMKWLKKALKDKQFIKIVDAARNIKDDGVNYISEEKLRKISSKRARESYGMTAAEVIRALDELLGQL